MADSPAERAQTFAQQAFPTYEIVETVDFEQDPTGVGELHEYNVSLRLEETDGTEEKTVELFVVDEAEASYLDGTGYTVNNMEPTDE